MNAVGDGGESELRLYEARADSVADGNPDIAKTDEVFEDRSGYWDGGLDPVTEGLVAVSTGGGVRKNGE